MQSKNNFYKWFLVFFIMSLFGFLVENIWAYYRYREILLKSSMVFGFLIPIYGLAALVLIFCLNKLKNKNIFLLFITSSVLGGVFESLCSLFQEYFLGTRSWNYSGKFMPFFEGRTCLKYCIFWGIIGVLWIKYLWPLLDKLLSKIDYKKLKIISITLLVLFTFDLTISWAACNRRVERYHEVEARGLFDVFLDDCFSDDYLSKRYTKLKIISK